MTNNFLLTTKTAVKLYQYVEELPLIDWHNHLSVEDLAADRHYANATQLWNVSDPYKHRAMRICGVPENQITGNCSDEEKFLAWSATVPKLIGNPLYHWVQLELHRYFGIDEELNETSAHRIWNLMNSKLQEPGFSARSFLQLANVEYAAPCVSIFNDIAAFPDISGIVPSFRGDDLLNPDQKVCDRLSSILGQPVTNLSSFRKAVGIFLDLLHARGCRFSDHALDNGFSYAAGGHAESLPVEKAGVTLKSEILQILGEEYAQRNWTVQLHIGAQRNTSVRLRKAAGPAGGFAGIGHTCDIASLCRMLNDWEQSVAGLPDVILYTLNPGDHAALANLSGSFPGDSVCGKVQLGPAWWYCDHIHGMRDCFEMTAAYGVLSVFKGMTTDSRSLLSFVRHEYFRRTLCNWVAEKVESGEFPNNMEHLVKLVSDICYYNIKKHIEGKK